MACIVIDSRVQRTLLVFDVDAQKMNIGIGDCVDVYVRRLTGNALNRSTKCVDLSIPGEEKLILASRRARRARFSFQFMSVCVSALPSEQLFSHRFLSQE